MMSMRLLVSLSLIALGASLPKVPLSSDALEDYTFDEYLSDFHKSYDDAEEYRHRHGIFRATLASILDHHRKRKQHEHELGINMFTDQDMDKDLPLGLVKPTAVLSAESVAVTQRRQLKENLPIEISPVSSLPDSVDWRTKGVTTPVKSQGRCGSCWAFATTAMLESHVALASGVLYSLSTQELVSCMSNPRKCGGDGGCMGATAELAMDFIQNHGVVQEWEFGYQSYHGEKVNCTLKQTSPPARRLRNSQNKTGTIPYYVGSVASITTWVSLPRNDYTTLMNAVAKMGPVAVSVAASSWGLYKQGVFDAPLNTTRQTNVNHLVVVEGYGTDTETGVDYWLVRNSWGPTWGEGGYIRLKRMDPATDPDAACGMDTTPADGVACTIDDKGNPIVPQPEKICGTSGVLYDTSIPVGAYLV